MSDNNSGSDRGSAFTGDSSPPQAIAKQPPAFSERWRAILPGISGDIVLAILRLVWWLLLLSYTEEGSYTIRLILTVAWVLAFLWRYVVRRGSSQTEQERLAQLRSKMGLPLPRSQVPVLAAVYVLTTIAVPWWGAAFTGGCAKQEWVDSVWPPRPTLTAPGLPFVLGALLIVLYTAAYPLIEEFSMRGWLLVPLRERIGTHWAVFAIALLFALLHLTPDPREFATIFVVAIGYGYAVVATGSVWTAVAMHFAWNFTNYLLATPTVHPYLSEAFRTALFRCGASRTIVALTSVAFAAVLLAGNHRRFRPTA